MQTGVSNLSAMASKLTSQGSRARTLPTSPCCIAGAAQRLAPASGEQNTKEYQADRSSVTYFFSMGLRINCMTSDFSRGYYLPSHGSRACTLSTGALASSQGRLNVPRRTMAVVEDLVFSVALMMLSAQGEPTTTTVNLQEPWQYHWLVIVGGGLVMMLWVLAANTPPLTRADVPAALSTGLRGRVAVATRRDAPRELPADGAAPGSDHAAAAAAAEPTYDEWTVLGDEDPELAAATPVEPVEPVPAAEAAAASAVAVEPPPPATPVPKVKAKGAQRAAAQPVPLPPPPATVQPVLLPPVPDVGAWITTTGGCMHTSRRCDGVKTAVQIRWATFHQQREAMLNGVNEAWTKRNDLNGILCLRERCVGPRDGPCNVGSLRKLRWCLMCGGRPVARIQP